MTLLEIEKCIYSQNGEDGIIEYLSSRVSNQSHVFVEIGCGTGAKCNSAYLAHAGWSGVAVDSVERRANRYAKRFQGIKVLCQVVTPESVNALVPRHPQVFSVDIDGFDFHVVQSVLSSGSRPAVFVVEYNASFEDRCITVPYPLPVVDKELAKFFYFGAGILAWRKLFARYGYRFVTVDSGGVNAFFVHDPIDLKGVSWVSWVDCKSLLCRFGPAVERWQHISEMEFEKVT